MILETKWNHMFLEKGIETIDMMQIELELKEIKRQLREQAVFKVREELEEDLDIAS
jgi:FtsZ-binding cell division protein ZapB